MGCDAPRDHYNKGGTVVGFGAGHHNRRVVLFLLRKAQGVGQFLQGMREIWVGPGTIAPDSGKIDGGTDSVRALSHEVFANYQGMVAPKTKTVPD